MKNTSLKYFRHIWKYADWSVIILGISVTFFKYRHYIYLFQGGWKIRFFDRIFKTCKKGVSKYIRIFFDNFCRNIGISWYALEVSNFKIYLRISSLFIFENDSLGCLLHTSPIASMLGWFLYLTTHFKTESLILLLRDPQLKHSAILRLLKMLEKEVFKTLAVLKSPIIISSLSIIVIFFVDLTLSSKKSLTVFQNLLLH